MPRKATGTAIERGGKLIAVVPIPNTKPRRRVWIDCPPTITSLPKAREYAAYLTRKVRAGELVLDNPASPPGSPAPEPQGESYEAWCERWVEARKARGLRSTADDRGCLATHVWPLLGKKPISAITAGDLEDVRDALDAKVRAKTIAWKRAVNIWGAVTGTFRDAAAGKDRSLRVLDKNPALGLIGPDRGAEVEGQYLYPSEALRLLAAASTPWPWALMFALSIYTGLRAGELEALTWADLDLEHAVLSVTKAVNRKTGKVGPTKTGETRRLPIEAELLPLLRQLRPSEQARQGERVCWMPPDEDRAAGLRKYLERAHVTRAELLADTDTTRQLTFHDLRATYITWLAIRGEQAIVIQQRAGHRQFSTTQGYIRAVEHLDRATFGRVFPPLPDSLGRGALGCNERLQKRRSPGTCGGFPG